MATDFEISEQKEKKEILTMFFPYRSYLQMLIKLFLHSWEYEVKKTHQNTITFHSSVAKQMLMRAIPMCTACYKSTRTQKKHVPECKIILYSHSYFSSEFKCHENKTLAAIKSTSTLVAHRIWAAHYCSYEQQAMKSIILYANSCPPNMGSLK